MENKSVGVYLAISKVMGRMASEGVGKDRKNAMQGYNFRGIDDMYNALSRPMVDAGLVVLPRVISRECVERTTAKGGAIFYVTVGCEFDFVDTSDGSTHTVKTFGEAMDSADKATNKAMSAAFKYACMQVFCIPTEGDNDVDGQTHEVAPAQRQQAQTLPPRRLSSAERELGVKDMKAAPDLSALKAILMDYHKMAKDIGDKESIAFFNDCYKECAAAFD